MPITLPPISRRRFLAGSLAAAASLALHRVDLFGAETNLDPDRLILLSDTHIHANREFVHTDKSTKPWENFSIVSEQIIATTKDKTAPVLITGDLACMKGLAGDYATLVDAVAPLRKANLPVHLLLGNHDDRANFWNALPKDDARTNDLADNHVLTLSTPRANLILLDSLELPANQTLGILGPAQLAWLAKALDADTTKPTLVFLHHHPIPLAEGKPAGIKDDKALVDLLLPRPHIKAVFFGHTHTWQHRAKQGLHFVNLPPTAWIFAPGRPQGWVDTRLRDTGATFTLHTLAKNHKDNGQTLDLTWR